MPKVERDISVRPVNPGDEHGLWSYINRELTPLVRAMRQAINGGSYEAEFDAGDVAGGSVTVRHNLGADIVHVALRDNENRQRLVADSLVEIVDDNSFDIDVSLFTVTGTWKILVSRG